MDRKKREKDDRGGKRLANRKRNFAKFQLPKDVLIEYKNVSLLQKFLNDRGKIIPRRITGISSKNQRKMANAIKRARSLALLTTGRVSK